MKKASYIILLSLLAFLFCSCQSNVSFRKGPFKKQLFTDPAKLDPDAKMALTTMEVAKFKYLKSFPYARISSGSQVNLRNKTDYFKFKQTNMVVVENTSEPEVDRTLIVACESIDQSGRRDISKNSIIYTMAEPSKKEKSAMAKDIMQSAKLTRQIKNAGLKQEITESVKEYQKANGLSADGAIGKNTIKSMLKDTDVVDVKQLEILPIYPENPRFEAHILWADIVVAANPGKFYKGFKSINNVRKKALSLEDLKKKSEASNDFVLFVYFFDRVNPKSQMSCGLSTTKKGASKIKSSYFYTDPHGWPVLVESIKIDSAIKSDKLYVNIYRNKKPMGDMTLGSYEIQ